MNSRFLIFFLAGAISAAAQNLSKFGEVTLDELEMSKYALDSSATAVILFDRGEGKMDEYASVTVKRHVRIKILSKSAFDWANFVMRLDRSSQRLSKIQAATYNLEEGKIITTPMADEAIFKSKYNKYRDQVKFTLPNVKEGSVIEYSYVFHASSSLIPDWQFQYDIPVVRSDFDSWIKGHFVQREVQGFLPIEQLEEKDNGREHFVMVNIPAFKTEPFSTTPEDFISKIHFYQSMRTWNMIVRNYFQTEEFGGQISGSKFLDRTLDELTAGITDSLKKIDIIYDYVKSNVEWDGFTDKIPDNQFKKVLEKKKGSSSEINLLLTTLLHKAGLAANPVLISTRENGLVRYRQNQVSQFNDLICSVKIGGKEVLLDATDKDLPRSALPERCLNGLGLVMSEAEPHWIPITSARSRRVITTEFKLDEAGILSGSLTISGEGLAGGKARRYYREMGEEKFLKSLLNDKNWDVTKSEFLNMTNPNGAAKENLQLVVRDHTLINGPLIYMNPFIMDRIEENQFKNEERHFPVDFATPFEEINMCKIVLADGIEIEELPKTKAIALPGNSAKYSYNVAQTGNTIVITSQFIINRSVFMPDEYPLLREFVNHVVAKQTEQIVLKLKRQPSK